MSDVIKELDVNIKSLAFNLSALITQFVQFRVGLCKVDMFCHHSRDEYSSPFYTKDSKFDTPNKTLYSDILHKSQFWQVVIYISIMIHSNWKDVPRHTISLQQWQSHLQKKRMVIIMRFSSKSEFIKSWHSDNNFL